MAKQSRHNSVNTLKTLGHLLLNKALAALVLAFLVHRWFATANGNTPFAEFFYAGILILGVIIVSPVVRLLVFPEAAEYAESGKLRDDIGMTPRQEGFCRPPVRFTPALVHYWFATTVCYAVVGFGAIALQGTGI